MDKQFLVKLKDANTGVFQRCWVVSPNGDNMQKFIDELPKDRLPAGITAPVVVSVEEQELRTIPLRVIAKAFPVLR